MLTASAAERPIRIVVLGDSLAAGFGLAAPDALPAKLEHALKARGIAVAIENAGVSGDTPAGGLARLDWSVGEGTDAVILELGANDALRGSDPKATESWATGTVYVLPRDTFEPTPDSRELTSTVPVRPRARLTVEPEDFPFRSKTRGHAEGDTPNRVALRHALRFGR